MSKDLLTKKKIVDRQMRIFSVFVDPPPPRGIVSDRHKSDELQNWVCDHLKPEFSYATGISIMEAADAIAIGQIENGMEDFATDSVESWWYHLRSLAAKMRLERKK